jgi:hypothetical protein
MEQRAQVAPTRRGATSIAEVIRKTREVLATARIGLQDMTSADPARRAAGMHNAVIFGRSVTNVLENIRTINRAGFNEWWDPRQQAMRDDPLLRYFYKLRSEIEKEGPPDPTVEGFYINHLGPSDMAEMQRHAPAGTKSIFIGDPQGRSGYEVALSDGTVEKVYFKIPESVGYPIFGLPDRPEMHLGQRISDRSMPNLCRIYLGYMENLIVEAERDFSD